MLEIDSVDLVVAPLSVFGNCGNRFSGILIDIEGVCLGIGGTIEIIGDKSLRGGRLEGLKVLLSDVFRTVFFSRPRRRRRQSADTRSKRLGRRFHIFQDIRARKGTLRFPTRSERPLPILDKGRRRAPCAGIERHDVFA